MGFLPGQLGTGDNELAGLPVRAMLPRKRTHLLKISSEAEATSPSGGRARAHKHYPGIDIETKLFAVLPTLATLTPACIAACGSRGSGGGGCSDAATSFAPSSPAITMRAPAVKVVRVACGHDHTVFLTEDGVVLTCGKNEVGDVAIPLPSSFCVCYELENLPFVSATNWRTIGR
jgi:hypothetical protein